LVGFEAVSKFVVPSQILLDTLGFLREAGSRRCEGLVLWVGHVLDSEAHVRQTVVPKQIAIQNHDGLSVHVDGETLYNLNIWLYENRLKLLVQVHSHGEHAYHSETDNQHSIVTTLGALSIVVPHFGNFASFESMAFLRLSAKGWAELPSEQVKKLIQVR
jgi:hypothetical protein